MKNSFNFLLLTFLAFFCPFSLSAQGVRGVLLHEAVIRISPDESSAQLGTAAAGHEVAVIERSRDWVKVLAALGDDRDITGWTLDKGIVTADTPNGDRILFGAAEDCEEEASKPHGRSGAAQEALRLYARDSEYFPKSLLAPEALYRAADIQWQIEYDDVMTLPSARAQDPDARPLIDEDDMRKVIKKYPHTRWADLAAYHLIDNKLCGDWEGESKCPQRESEIYEKYAGEHPQSPKAPEALYKAAWRQSALIAIYQTENRQDRSRQAHDHALQLAGQVVSQYPDSDWAPRAAALAYSVQQGISTYGSSRE